MKVSYPETEIAKKRLHDIKPGECFKCEKGALIYMKVYFKRRPNDCMYGVNIVNGAVYPFEGSKEYEVIPLTSKVLIGNVEEESNDK